MYFKIPLYFLGCFVNVHYSIPYQSCLLKVADIVLFYLFKPKFASFKQTKFTP